MKKTHKIIALALSACMLGGTAAVFAGCGEGSDGGSGGSWYDAEMLSSMEDPVNDYNSDLFYVNSLEFGVADPSVIYITEGKDAGYFYAYGTSDEIDGHGIQCWRSKDLSHWETRGVAFTPDWSNTWAVDNYWAPEVLYDETDQLYYMIYNAFHLRDKVGKNNRLCVSVAWSENPDGPFVSPSGSNADGKPLSPSEPVYDLSENNPDLPQSAKDQAQNIGFALDAHMFIDDDGTKYVYFGWYGNSGDGTHVWGMRMKGDWYTPDYSTLTELTAPGYSTLERYHTGGSRDRASESHINEGPHVIKHDGKYYLTFSVNGYTEPQYRVIQAIADSPLGVYTKIAEEKGGKVISTSMDWLHLTSAGHHCFLKVGDELFIAYHTFKNRISIANGRALAVDRVVWTKNSDGVTVMHTNGPTWSLQPLPEAISGYKNIAPSATLTTTDEEGGEEYLTDGLVKYQDGDLAGEYFTEKGSVTVTLSWNDYKTVRGLMVYNSYDYFAAFDKVSSIRLTYLKPNGTDGFITIKNVKYDLDWFEEVEEYDDWYFVRPGGSAMVEFNDLAVRSIEITVNKRRVSDIEGIGIGEIYVLGADAPCEGVNKPTAYSYRNGTCGSAHIIRDSKTFGTIVLDGQETTLATMYGYDLSHDDGTENAYIEQHGVRDQYAYFKDIYSTEFYVEAEFTALATHGFADDAFPKFGIVVSCDDSGASSTMFYYIDAQNGYTLNQIGTAARAAGSKDNWDWAGSERTCAVEGLRYVGEATAKLAIIRRGKQFWFLCNDKLYLTSNSFMAFSDTQKAGVGFLSFNTPMRISKYYATQDSSIVSQKIAQYVPAE